MLQQFRLEYNYSMYEYGENSCEHCNSDYVIDTLNIVHWYFLHSINYSSDFVENVELTSNKTRQLTCPGDLVIFTCRVFVSSSLEWRSPLITEQILYTASDRPPRILRRGSFTASLTNVSGTPLEANFTSTLQVTASTVFMSNATVMCLSSTPESETDNFTAAGK